MGSVFLYDMAIYPSRFPGKSDTRFVTSAAKWEIEKVELSQSMRPNREHAERDR